MGYTDRRFTCGEKLVNRRRWRGASFRKPRGIQGRSERFFESGRANLIMNIEEIRQLIDLANESGVAELEVQRGENRVRIRRAVASPAEYVVGSASPAAASAPASPAPAPAAAAAPEADSNLITVKSPIVGTYYESPSPGAEPFIAIGDAVKPGDILCIIESMKLMNEIECEHAGVVVTRFVENGQPVEYGEPLMAIRPH